MYLLHLIRPHHIAAACIGVYYLLYYNAKKRRKHKTTRIVYTISFDT